MRILMVALLVAGCMPAHAGIAARISKYLGGAVVTVAIEKAVEKIWNILSPENTADPIVTQKPDEATITISKEALFKAVKQEIVDEIVKGLHANSNAVCNFGESEINCRTRIETEALTKLNAYAVAFKLSYDKCRDAIVLSPKYGGLDFQKQVVFVNQCMANTPIGRSIRGITSRTTDYW